MSGTFTGTITSGTIGNFTLSNQAKQDTTINAGHYYSQSLYLHSNGTYTNDSGIETECEYESGISLDNSLSTNTFVYVRRLNSAGTIWNSNNTTLLFYIRKDGYLYASNVNVTGTINGTFTGAIKAKSGTIGENATNKITIGTNTTNASIYFGMSTYNNTTNNGFYLGTDGLALGKGAFKVTNEGELTVTKGTIGGCNITNGALKVPAANITGIITAGALSGNVSINSPTISGGTISNTSITNGNQIFSVTSAGAVTANNITIGSSNNTLTYDGSTLTVKGTLSGTFSGTATVTGGSLTIGSTFSVNSSGVLTATSGTIANWSFNNTALYKKNNNSVLTGYSNSPCGIKSAFGNSSTVLWVGGAITN